MSAFTFTAPIHTEEDDRAERAAMTEDEQKRYRSEIYGTEPDFPETEEMIQNGLELLQSALHEIPAEAKMDYLEAVDQAPELVEAESSPIGFLRVSHYDAWAAASRLVEYWSTRKKIFGQERSLLPMTFRGAMAEELQYLEKAVLYVLEEDEHQRPVVFFDRMRCTKDVLPRDSAVRCFWYVLQVLAEQERNQRRGYVIIANYRGCDLYKHFDRILSRKFFWVAGCMPVRVRCVHFCTGSGASVTRDLILPVLMKMAGRDNRLRLQLHAGSTSEILVRFRDYGMGEPHVNAIFGGEGGNRVAVQPWLSERRRIELTRRGDRGEAVVVEN